MLSSRLSKIKTGLIKDNEEIKKLLAQIEKGAKDLGTDVTDIPVANQLDEIGVNLEDSINDIRNARRDAEEV